MKKLIALLLALCMVMALAACGNKETEKEENTNTNTNTNSGEDKALASSALEILETIWNDYAEDDQFAVTGGDPQTHYEKMEEDENYMPPNAPGVYNLEYAEELTYTLLIPAEQLENIDEAATMTHMMLANNFSCGAFHVNGDVSAFANAVKETVMNNQWMCGQPETLIIVSFGGGYVMMAYGIADAMDPFVEHMNTVYAGAEVLVEESLI